MKKSTLILAFFIATVITNAQKLSHTPMEINTSSELASMMKKTKILELNRSMRNLWNAHMHWTLITVDAYYNDPKGLNAKLDRLLQNQKDIGAAIVPYYDKRQVTNWQNF
jgi:hypothetical protein